MTNARILKQGDRVTLLNPEGRDFDPPKHSHGTVAKIASDGEVLVQWDNWFDGHGRDDNRWWMERKQLRYLK